MQLGSWWWAEAGKHVPRGWGGWLQTLGCRLASCLRGGSGKTAGVRQE